jgi:2-(1,2-epoxy-1,2-dihydrophenyl)acetyl-CoA isomerase
MTLRLQALLDEAQQDPEVRAVYLTGEGKAFSAGQDLKEVQNSESSVFVNALEEHYNPIIERIRQLEKPVLAAVNGVAAGAGANIALACDVVVATASASFIQAFSKIGLIPDCAGTFFLPRLIGWQRASALMLLGDKLSATEAASMGMIYKVFPDEQFAEEAWALAIKLSMLPTRGLALTKAALQQSFSNNLDQQLAVEVSLQAAAAATDDYAEGVKAFIEKRAPVFTGK